MYLQFSKEKKKFQKHTFKICAKLLNRLCKNNSHKKETIFIYKSGSMFFNLLQI